MPGWNNFGTLTSNTPQTLSYGQYGIHWAVVPLDLDRDGIAQSQHTVASTPLTLNGALASGGSYTATDGTGVNVGHLIGVYSSANIASDVFTITGTDPDGLAISETVTGINNTTVFTTKYFYTVTSVSDNTTQASNNVEVGIGTTVATPRVVIDRNTNFSTGCGVDVTGTASVTMQLTMDDLHDGGALTWIADTSFATKTATFFMQLAIQCAAVRFVTVSYTVGATLQFHVLQNKASD